MPPSIPPRTATVALGLAALVLCAPLAACGSGERSFDAEEFVQRANEAGAGIELGAPLFSEDAEKQIFGIAIAAEGEGRADAGAAGDSGADERGGEPAGTLTVLGDAEEARTELERCRSAASLVCYRAANVMIAHEQAVDSAEAQRIAAALTRLRDEG